MKNERHSLNRIENDVAKRHDAQGARTEMDKCSLANAIAYEISVQSHQALPRIAKF